MSNGYVESILDNDQYKFSMQAGVCKLVWIYVLICPITGQIRYVGKTIDVEKRFKRHIIQRKTQTHKANWIKSLYTKGLRPSLKILHVTEKKEGDYWERYYIKKFRDEKLPLTNLTDGGGGGDTYTNNPQKEELLERLQKLNIGRPSPFKGQRLSKKHKREIKRGLALLKQKGYKHSTERNEKIKKALTGIKRSEETKRKLSQVRKGTQVKEKNHNAKKFKLISSSEQVYEICGNLREFCYKHNLSYKGIIRVHQRKQKESKGWKCANLGEIICR